jgi:hypothetical protein
VQYHLGTLERDDAKFARAVEVYRQSLERLRGLESRGKLDGLPDAYRDLTRALRQALDECEAADRASR